MENFKDLTNLYSVQKTIRMGLIPEKKTLENIMLSGLLEEDIHRAESYKKVKKLIDNYHKAHIDIVLKDFKFSNSDDVYNLSNYFLYYNIKNRDDHKKEMFTKIKSCLRKQISDALKNNDKYKRIFKKELIQEDLVEFVESEEDLKLINEFKNFTTYFTGFNENRANMYSDEEKSTAISYRIINENLPKFIDNINTFDKVFIIPEIEEGINILNNELKQYISIGSIKEMFTLNYFNSVLTQSQIETYNSIIGGISDENVKIKGFNEIINLYNQKHKENKLPKFKFLFKQILSERESISWLPEEFNSDKELLDSIKSSYELLNNTVLGNSNLKNLLLSLKEYNVDGIYIRNDLQLTDISQKMFVNWSAIKNAILSMLKDKTVVKKSESDSDYQSRILKIYKNTESFSIGFIDKCLSSVNLKNTVEDYFAQLGAVNNNKEQTVNLFSQITNAYTDCCELFSKDFTDENSLITDKQSVAKIKFLLDSLKKLQHYIKPLLGQGDESLKDERFYSDFVSLWNELDKITPLYNKVRNYLTRKPYSRNKIKLNFGNPILLNGWALKKERDYSCILLRDKEFNYLAILDKNGKKGIKEYPAPKNSEDVINKMVYLQVADPSKDVPSLMVVNGKTVKLNGRKEDEGENNGKNIKLEEYKNLYLPDKINQIRKSKSYLISNDTFCTNDLVAYIDYYKERVNEYYSSFKFLFLPSNEYKSFNDFTNHINQQAYQLYFIDISKSYINKLVEEGKLYLFKIYNKDFSSYSKGTPNMHTLYWKMLFDKENLKNVVYKLNGNGEVFYRKRSLLNENPTHVANVPIKNKNINNEKKESVFTYDLTKDRRYTVDHFELHVPISMNFKSKGLNNINEYANQFIKDSEDIHIIGIDRGERHLLYLTVIDSKGVIKEQYSLNELDNNYNKTNYHKLLDQREQGREKARESWQSIENIKELKEGYLSQVIYKITQLMVKYNAIVVLEDLNDCFKRGRQKVEKQVYQKFEKMLIEKLNYLVDKQINPDNYGGLFRAFQLTNKFESFQKIGKQTGFLFYIPAWNTSKIDPVTGFINLFNFHYESIEKSKSLIEKFDIIRYNIEKGLFEFSFDYNKFTSYAEGTRTKWSAYSYGTRVETYRNTEKNSQWESKEINLTDEFINLFSKYNIDIKGNLKEAIMSQTEKDFFVSLHNLLNLTFQMRNSITGSDIDYLISPVPNSEGVFYDSRFCDDSLPKNADANGAYNIARKGLMMVSQIKGAKEINKIKFDVTNKSYLKFVQDKQ